MNRREYIDRIQDAIGDRKLIWVGTRGHDAIGLMSLAQFSEVYSVAAPLGAISLNVDYSLENLTRGRVDLDTYTIDRDHSPPANTLRRVLLHSLTQPAVVVSYRPLALLSAICYPRSEFVSQLGMFHERQATFEHKPWVETELGKIGITVIPWRYFAEGERLRLREELTARGVLVIRANRSDGGAGLRTVRTMQEMERHAPRSDDGFVGAAPLLEPHVPLNIGACVFANGKIALHPPSIQLIGIESCSGRQFGYCGNDFAAFKFIDKKIVKELEEMTVRTGRWLWMQGYIGAYGLDALVYDSRLYLTEVNPRFQGSSVLSARIDREMSRSDIYMNHIAACLGLDPPRDRMGLLDMANSQPSHAHIVIHNNNNKEKTWDSSCRSQPGTSIELLPEPGTTLAPNAIMCRIVVSRAITATGRSLEAALVRYMESGLFQKPATQHDFRERGYDASSNFDAIR